MHFQIDEREKDGIRILDLRGSLTIGQSETLLREAVIALAEAGVVNLIINFAHANEIDQDGLESLVFSSSILVKSGGALKLLNLGRVHIDLIVLVGLDAAFDVFTDEQDAVNSFFPDRAIRRFDILDFVRQQEKDVSRKPPT